MIDMKKIMAILRSDGVRVLEPEKRMMLCDILKASIAFNRNPARAAGSRLVMSLPSGFTYRKQMWVHFKECKACGLMLRSLYREKKSIDITIVSEADPGSRAGVLKVEIKLKPFEFKTEREEVLNTSGTIVIE